MYLQQGWSSNMCVGEGCATGPRTVAAFSRLSLRPGRILKERTAYFPRRQGAPSRARAPSALGAAAPAAVASRRSTRTACVGPPSEPNGLCTSSEARRVFSHSTASRPGTSVGCGHRGKDWRISAAAAVQAGEEENSDGADAGASAPRVVTVAGSDSGGGAGIQADLKTFVATGVFGMSCVTSVTAQNTAGVQDVHVLPTESVVKQLDSVLGDIGADALKCGLLPTPEIVQAVAEAVRKHKVANVVVDPVMVSTSGSILAGNEIVSAMRNVLFPLATVVTPNIPEAEALLAGSRLEGLRIRDLASMERAARSLHALGPAVVLIKGGHLSEGPAGALGRAVDVAFDGRRILHLSQPRIETANTHGTGCTLASAVAARLAEACYSWEVEDPMDAVVRGKQFVTEVLDMSRFLKLGSGPQSPMNHGYRIADWGGPTAPSVKNPCDLRCYAVTDSGMNDRMGRTMVEALRLAMEGGATIVQLREKDIDTRDFIARAEEVMRLGRQFGVPVLINDRVDVALAVDADGVHVGQEDMTVQQARALLGPSKIIGVSCKTPAEAVEAEAGGADYLGVGAVFPTKTKDSSVIGLDGLGAVCKAVDIPIVSIGGVNVGNAASTVRVGCAGVAVVSDIFLKKDPKEAAKILLEEVEAELQIWEHAC